MTTERPRIQLGVPMPPPRRHKTPVYRPRPGQAPITVVIVNHRPAGLLVHYTGTEGAPHWPEPWQCEWCSPKNRPYWTAFLGAWDNVKKCRCLVEVTRNLVGIIPELRSECQESLRGRSLTIYRGGDKVNSPLVGSLSPDCLAAHVCPPEFSLARALEVLWRLPDDTLYFPDDPAADIDPAWDADGSDPEVQGL